MPIHDFSQQSGKQLDGGEAFRGAPTNGDKVERLPNITEIINIPKRDDIWFERQNVDVSQEVSTMLPNGYKTMDRGIKNYFSGIRIPSQSGIKLLQTRISGGDKPYQIWSQDLMRGRITLPVMSIKRESEEPFLDRFSPAHYHHLTRRFVDEDMTRIALSYRPVPSKIKYVLSIWAEHKTDLEYVLYQIRSRFMPIAEFYVQDQYIKCVVVLHYQGMSVAIDDEAPPDQRVNKRYDINIEMEGFLPLPEKIVPSILGRVTTLKDGGETSYGDVFQTIQGKLDLSDVNLRR